MARKLSLDEHWECAPDLTQEQKARVVAAANATAAMREKALAWVRDNAARLTVVAEYEDGEDATDIAALEAAIEEESAATLSAWLENPEGVTLNGGWGHSDSIIHVNIRTNNMWDNYNSAAITNIYGEAQKRLRQIDALIASGGPYEGYNRARRAQLIDEYNERLRQFGDIDPHVEDTI